MSGSVYKLIEVTGESTVSSDDAIQQAIKLSAKSVRGMRWFQVSEIRGDINEDQVAHWQVTVKIGFRIED